MSHFNVNQNHPLIPNSNSYVVEKKYVSIHSQDRDISSYPLSSLFEIELPQYYVNVQSVRLSTWSFPANYNVFSLESNNIFLVFDLDDIYDPVKAGNTDPLQLAIYEALTTKQTKPEADLKSYIATISSGFYNPDQMANELGSRMNQSVTKYITEYFTKIEPKYKYLLQNFSGYDQFIIAYNSVAQKLFFGNKSSSFTITNASDIYFTENRRFDGSCGLDPRKLPDFSNWGLPAFLGFLRVSQQSIPADDPFKYNFFYGDAITKGDKGKWLLPNLKGATAYFLVPPTKINFMGPAYFYMELTTESSFNCIDETSPFNISKFTLTTNQTNGRVNNAFAKIAVPTTPISQWFDNSDQPYKWFNPPMSKFKKIAVKLRYHNGQLVDFGTFDYSFMLELTILKPQIQTNLNQKIPSFSDSFS